MLELVPRINYSFKTLLEISNLQIKRSSNDNAQCHSCSELVPSALLSVCSNEDCKCSGYCDACLQKLFHINIIDTLRDPKWVCYLCKKSCCCPACSPKNKQKIEESPQPKDIKSTSLARTSTKVDPVAPSALNATVKSAPSFSESITPPSSPSAMSQPPPPPIHPHERTKYSYPYSSPQNPQSCDDMSQKRRRSLSRSSSASSSASSRSSSASSSSLSSSSSSSGSMSPRSKPRRDHHHRHSDSIHHKHDNNRRPYNQPPDTKSIHRHNSNQRNFGHSLSASSLSAFGSYSMSQSLQSMSMQDTHSDMSSSMSSVQQSVQHHHHHMLHHDKKRIRSRSRSTSKSRHSSSMSGSSSLTSSSSSLFSTSSSTPSSSVNIY